MKRKILIFAASILLVIGIGVLIFVFGFQNTNIKVDNTTPAEQIVTKKYGLEKQLLVKEIFYVRRGFHDVNAFALAKEVGIKLECKRQVSEDQFYYVVLGDYRCFIIVDEENIVQEVLTVRKFPTIAQAKKTVERLEKEDDGMYITDTFECGFRYLWRACGSSSVYLDFYFPLQDGALLIRTTGKIAKGQYLYFTEEEWQQEYEDWECFVILPIDKQ